jgi:hypothetical protein
MNNRFYRKFLPMTLVFLVFAGGVLWAVVREVRLQRPEAVVMTTSGYVDMCLSCHKDVQLDGAHDAKILGCVSCHLGDPLAVEKDRAHAGMVINPGDLRVVEQTCAVQSCHARDAHKVKNSLMATNRGILGTLLYYWGESEHQDTSLTVEQLLQTGQTSFALDYFRKLCGTCHLWKQKNNMPQLPQFFNDKGGGCSACHSQPVGETVKAGGLYGDQVLVVKEKQEKKPHPHVTRRVTSEHCVRCHNRSGRIGISYLGIFESEGYGTPYEEGGLNRKQLPGGRFYLDMADDIHHAKGMECIDCHTRDEIMGDGTSYAHYEEQLEIRCLTCHTANPGQTAKKHELNNIDRIDGNTVLIGKVDDKQHPLRPVRSGVCDFVAHKRVSCEACHSTWVAQCYGCHVRRDKRKTHLDKLSLAQTPGLWEEGRSYIRYEQPMLGVWEDEVVVVTPGCQDFVTSVDEEKKLEKQFARFTMAAINPHTTQAKGRPCLDCHGSTKTIGLGEGKIVVKNDKLEFVSVHQGIDFGGNRTAPLDGYVTIDGTPLQHSSRPDLRPFNGEELQRILRVGLCVRCHDTYQDPIWKTYTDRTKCPKVPVMSDFPEIKKHLGG